MNGSSAGNNGNVKPQRPTTMTSSANRTTQFESSNILNDTGSTQNATVNLQTLPTISCSSSSASSSSLLKSSSRSPMDDGQQLMRTTPTNGHQSPPCIPTASTSTKNRPGCVKISELSKVDCCNDASSGCECSDDELITKFREKYGDQPLSPVTTDKATGIVATKTTPDNLTGSSSSSTKTGNTSDTPLKDEASAMESSDISSFEDLGAVGGLQTTVSIPSTSDMDIWQIINPTWNIDDTASSSSMATDDKNESINVSYTTNLPNSITELPQNNTSENQRQEHPQTDDSNHETFREHSTNESQRTDLRKMLEKRLKSRPTHRKITRRQSDEIVYSASTSNTGYTSGRFLDDLEGDEDGSSTSEDVSHKRTQKSCGKCGKTKGDLKKYIARFRHQLETTTAFSETEIRQQLDAFLEFLENLGTFDIEDDDSVIDGKNTT